jgi:hypothetical protein
MRSFIHLTIGKDRTVPERTSHKIERIGAIMGGKVLELETDRILENRKQGLEVTLCHTEIENIMKCWQIKYLISQMLKEHVSTEKIILYTGCTREDIEKISRENLS